MNRTTALKTVERRSFGGSFHDSFSWQKMFRKYKPHDFGVKAAELFSSKLHDGLVNKKFIYYTQAQGNVYYLPQGVDDYSWYVIGDANEDLRSAGLLVATNAKPGKGKLPFKILLNHDWVHEPTLLKTEHPNLPLLRILGYPVQRSVNQFEYEVELQTSNPDAYIPVEYLQRGRKFIDASTSVSDELNQKYGGEQFGEMFKLQSWTGNFARKAEFTDKFIRLEISSRESGRSMVKGEGYSVGGKQHYGYGISVGHMYKEKFGLTRTGESPQEIQAGVFITQIEALLEERLMMDKEMNFEFGQLEKTTDRDSSRPLKVAAGYRQIVKEGHYKEHNGTLTLSELYEFISEIFLTRRDFSDRKIKIATGEGGVEYLHRLIAKEASQFQYVDTLFTKKRDDAQGYHTNELEYGGQFTKLKLPMGYILEMVYDPIKDDRKIFPEKAPGTNRTLESFSMDIFDLGQTDQKAFDARRPENITMVAQDGMEIYYHTSNVYDFVTGAKKSGETVASNNKKVGIYRECSAGLCVWDVTRIGKIAYSPYTTI